MKRSKFSLGFRTSQEVLTHQVAPTKKKIKVRKKVSKHRQHSSKIKRDMVLKQKLQTSKNSANQGYLKQ